MAKEKTRLGLFDHIAALTEHQKPDYFDKLTDDDKKTWSNFLILRYLSMQPTWVDVVSEVQPYVQGLSPELFYKVFIDILPKGKQYLKYISGRKKADGQPDWLIDLAILYYQVSHKQAVEYLDILYSTRKGQEEINELCEMYAVPKKQITTLKLKI